MAFRRWTTGGKLAPHDTQAIQKTLEKARELLQSGRRYGALKEILRLPNKQKNRMLPEIIGAFQVIGDKLQQVNTLVELASYLPELARRKILSDALAIVRTIEKKYYQKPTLTTLVSRIAELGYSNDALNVMQAIEDEDARADALTALVPHLSEALLRQALGVEQAIEDENARARVFFALVCRLAELGFAEEALAIAQTIESENQRVGLLRVVVPQLAKQGFAEKALAIVKVIENEERRANILAALVPYLSKALLNQVFEVAQTIQDTNFKTNVLVKLAPQLAKHSFPEKALTIAQTIQTTEVRINVLKQLVPHLPKELQDEVLDTVQNLSKNLESYFSDAAGPEIQVKMQTEQSILTQAAFRLAKEGRPHEALAALRTISNAQYRATMLEKWTDLPEESKNELIQEALTTLGTSTTDFVQGVDPHDHREQLADLVSHLTELPPAMLYPLWCEARERCQLGTV